MAEQSSQLSSQIPADSVVVRPWSHVGRIAWRNERLKTVDELISEARGREFGAGSANVNVYATSLDSYAEQSTGLVTAPIDASANGLLHAIERAYNCHNHLILRPEDIWLQILVQFSVYVNKNAKNLRSYFVDHEGRKELCVTYGEEFTRWTFPYGAFTRAIAEKLHENIKDPELRDWIIPDFSTTTEQDRQTASIIMMATLKEFFSYKLRTMCGIPSITLLGKREDYENILRRLDKLDRNFGPEPARFAALLRPVIRGFIETFDDPTSKKVIDFWRGICDINAGSGFTEYSGWMTAFAFWNDKGVCMGTGRNILGGTSYPKISELPMGAVKVGVTIDDRRGPAFQAEMVAGSIGISHSSSGQQAEVPIWEERRRPEGVKAEAVTGLDRLQPLAGWWIQDRTERKQEETPDYIGRRQGKRVRVRLFNWFLSCIFCSC